MFVSDSDLEGILIFSILASVLVGINHLILDFIINQSNYEFYQINVFFNILKYILIIGFSLQVSINWRQMTVSKGITKLLMVLFLSVLCALQVKIVTDDGIIFSSVFGSDEVKYEQVKLVEIKDDKVPFPCRISYTVVFDNGKK